LAAAVAKTATSRNDAWSTTGRSEQVPFIEQVTDETASGDARELLEKDLAVTGYVQNFMRVLALRPDVFAAWKGLRDAIQKPMDFRRYELSTVAAATQLHSSYCSLAHGKILSDRFVAADAVCTLAAGGVPEGLDEADLAVVELARKVAGDASSVTQADIDRCHDAGLTDGEILEVVLSAAIRAFFTKVLDATGVQPDSIFRELEPELREALTFERAIA
jgi:uncharacterized peroxidase-related enzyme